MSRSSKTTERRRSFWIITRHEENGRMEALTIYPGGERTLPVFSFEEEAEVFLGLEKTPDEGWRARETMAGELVSLLYGLCAGVKKVALDPLPTVIDGKEATAPMGVDWRRLVRDLVGERALGFPNMDPEETYVPDYVMWDFDSPRSKGQR